MKNIFKLMSVAVLAASMIFVSCKKDPNNDEPQNNSVQKVNFNGTEWTASDIIVDFSFAEQFGVYDWQIQKGANDSDPFTFGYTGTTAGRSYEFDGQSSGIAQYYYFVYVVDDDDYFESNGQTYPNHQPYTCISNLTAFDVTAKTTSMTVNAQLIDYMEYLETQELNPMPMTVTLTDATWAEAAE